jgi:hypothetical protein
LMFAMDGASIEGEDDMGVSQLSVSRLA